MKILVVFGLVLSLSLISCSTTPVKTEYISVYKKAVNTCVKPSKPEKCVIPREVSDFIKFRIVSICLLDRVEYVAQLNNYITCLEQGFEGTNG